MATLKQQKLTKLAETTIVKREELTEDLWRMWIEKPEGYTFKAGQYCTIGVDGLERAYSIVSAPHEEHLELFIELVSYEDGGHLTPVLYDLKAGNKVSIRPRAKGIFTFKPEYKDHVLVATVTGVVPYISFIRDYMHRHLSGHHFYVLEGASYWNEFGYDEELQHYADKRPDIVSFVPCVSRPTEEKNSHWEGARGRVNHIVEEHLDQFNLSKEDTLIYACGHPGMIEDVKARFVPKGWHFEEERFWKED